MKLKTFELEKYYAKWEFKAPYLMCSSDFQTMSMQELLSYADKECTKMWNNLDLGYTEVPGHPKLRAEAATLYNGLSADNILCFSGAEEGIYCFMQAMLDAKDHVIAVTPCYQSLTSLPEAIGCDITAIELNEDKGWKLDLQDVRNAINKNTKAIIINYPHNPTGQVLDDTEIDELVAIAREHDLSIFSDEVYRMIMIGDRPVSKPIAEVYEKGFSLYVTSKALGLAGLRIGWLASQDTDALEKISEYKQYTTICNSAPSEILALIALRAKDQILAKNKALAQKNLKLVDAFVERNRDLVSWVRPEGGCVGMMKLLTGESAEAFAEELVNKTGILVLPPSTFEWKDTHFRIGFGRANLPEVLVRFENYIRSRKRQ